MLAGIFKNATWYLFGSLIGHAHLIVTLPIVTRWIAPAEYGIVVLFLMAASFATNLLGAAVLGGIAPFYVDLKGSDRQRCLGTICVFLYGLAVLIVFAAYALVDYLLPVLFPHVPKAAYVYFPLALLIGAVSLAHAVMSAIARIEERPQRVLTASVLKFVLGIALTALALIYLDLGFRGYLAALLLTEVGVAILSFRMVRHAITYCFDPVLLRPVLAYCLPLVPHVFLGLVRDISDRAILQTYVGMADIGVYGVGLSVGMIVNLVASSIAGSYSPRMFKVLQGRPDSGERLLRFKSTGAHVMVVLFGASMVLSLGAQEFFELLIGRRYLEAWKVATWIGLAYAFRGAYLFPHNYFQWIRNTKIVPVLSGVGLIVSACFIFLLAPAIGIYAGAIGLGVSYIGSVVVAGVLAREKGWVLPYEFHRVAPWCAFALITVALAHVLAPLGLGQRVSVKAVYALVIGSFALWRFGGLMRAGARRLA